MKIRLRSLAILTMLTACTSTQLHAAPVSFAVTATADSTGSGYVAGQAYTFYLLTGESFSINASSVFDGVQMEWDEEFVTEDSLWSSITGSAMTGTYTRSAVGNNHPNSVIQASDFGSVPELFLRAGSDENTNIGLFTPGGQGIRTMDLHLRGQPDFSITPGYMQPSDFFADYHGTYTLDGSSTVTMILLGSPNVTFVPTSLTISPVPEPGATLLLGGFVLGALTLARRRPVHA